MAKTVAAADRKVVFLRRRGRLTKTVIWKAFAATLEKAVIEKNNRKVHSIRHSCATHLLEAGADVRTKGLKRMFKSYHPRENELYREVDGEYQAAAAGLKAELLRKWQKIVTMKGDL